MSQEIAVRHTAETAPDENGAAAVEYGLLIALIAGVIISIVIILGGSVDGAYSSMHGTFW